MLIFPFSGSLDFLHHTTCSLGIIQPLGFAQILFSSLSFSYDRTVLVHHICSSLGQPNPVMPQYNYHFFAKQIWEEKNFLREEIWVEKRLLYHTPN